MSKAKSPKRQAPLKQPAQTNPIRWQYVVLLILPFLLYANTLGHQYALDDAMVVTDNSFVKEGFQGIPDIFANETFVGFFGKQKDLVAGGRYRPLSVATFAAEHELFGQSPGISHFLNIVFYALCGYLVYLILFRLLSAFDRYRVYASTIPFLAALLFVVHPIHTEVVVNIKGRDEIFSLLFSLAALWVFIRKKNPGLMEGLASAGLLLLAIFSKENAYPFVLLIPITAWWFYRKPVGELVIPAVPLLAVAIIGLWIRYSVLGQMSVNQEITELMNDPFLGATATQKFTTIFYTWGMYLKLMVFPHPLTHDYYPYQIALQSFSSPWAWVSLAAVGWMIMEVIRGLRKRHLAGYAFLFFLSTFFLVSNLIFPIGTFMGERLMFMPSVGLCLFGAWVLVNIPGWTSRGRNQFSVQIKSARQMGTWFAAFRGQNAIGLVLFAVLVIGFSYKTISRNPVWKNNESLFLTDVHTSENSAKMQNAAGGMLYDLAQASTTPQQQQQYYAESKQHLLKAVQIHPTYQPAWKTLGNVYYYLDHDFDNAIQAYVRAGETSAYDNMLNIGRLAVKDGDVANGAKCFRKYIELRPGQEAGYTELAQAFVSMRQPDSAIAVLNQALQKGLQTPDIYVKLGLAYGQGKGDMQTAISYFNKALEVNPNSAEAYKNLGVAYGMTNQPQKAIENLEAALRLNPDNPQTHRNMAFAYRQLGNEQQAREHEARAQAIEQNH